VHIFGAGKRFRNFPKQSFNGKRYLRPCVSTKGACLVLSAHALRFSMDAKLLQRIFGYTKRFKKPLSSWPTGDYRLLLSGHVAWRRQRPAIWKRGPAARNKNTSLLKNRIHFGTWQFEGRGRRKGEQLPVVSLNRTYRVTRTSLTYI